MDYEKEAKEKEDLAHELLIRKGLFKKPDPDGAISNYEKAANLYKMAKNYHLAGECYYAAASAQINSKQEAEAPPNLNNSINCFNLCNPEKSSEVLEKLIQISAETGKFMQAGKAAITQAEKLEENHSYVEARKTYERAIELLQSEANTDSEIRTCELKIAEIIVIREEKYIEAAKLYEEIATKCLKIKLLQFHSRGYFFSAYLCIFVLNDEIASEDAYNRYISLDPNLDGAPEGDYMKESLEAFEEKSSDKFLEAYGKLNARENLRGNMVAKTLLVEAEKLFAETEEKEAEGDVEDIEQNNTTTNNGPTEDEDLL